LYVKNKYTGKQLRHESPRIAEIKKGKKEAALQTEPLVVCFKPPELTLSTN
jgi:hypothetical protein